MRTILTFGELMLRLKAPGHERFLQSPTLEATFGGGEANVAVSLANYGLKSGFISKLPDHDLSQAALRELRGLGVDVSRVVLGEGRLGIYYLEGGSMQRPSRVIYDRSGSAMAEAKPEDFDFDAIFEDAHWLHLTGITPAISQGAAALSLQAVKAAKAHGLQVSCDLNFRKNLWQWGKTAKEVMPGLLPHVDTLIANEEDCQKSLGIGLEGGEVEGGEVQVEHYEQIARKVRASFPNLSRVAITLRQSNSADRNTWQACLLEGERFYLSRAYALDDIVDRVGGGDSFCGGLIYGLNRYQQAQDALAFAVAASALKHSIPGDYNRVGVAEVEALMRGSGSGRVQR